ncbi:MAG: glycosyltransferase family 4 protein [Gammaproteobacteria bacterium]|nr:glycosyltransferase family 4 protein [Gammaproteobacteria bacterium]
MRIVFVTPEFVSEPYFSGGLANYIHRASIALSRMGNEVHVMVLSNRETTEAFGPITLHRVKEASPSGIIFRIIKRIDGGQFIAAYRQLIFSFKIYWKLKSFNEKNKIDIVQFPNYQASGLVSCMGLNVPIVSRISSYRPLWNQLSGKKATRSSKTEEWLERLQLQKSPNIFAPSQLLKKIVEQKESLNNVKVIPTPFFQEEVELDESQYKEHLSGKEYILFFGRLQLHKGVEILTRALPDFFNACPQAFAVFAGKDMPTPLGPSMKEFITSVCYKYKNRLIFFDQLHHKTLYPVIRHSRIVVLPSLIDNLPNTLLESMALGKVVIGTTGASFDEVIKDNITGFLVEKGNSRALAEKMIEIWDHPELEKIGKAAAQSIKALAPDQTICELETYYRKLRRD